MKDKKKNVSNLFNIMKVIPIVLIIIVLFFTIKYYDSITIDNIVKYTPENTILAIIIILGLYFIKSISIILPTAILYGASGKLFSLPLALAVNFIGLAIILTVPYAIGKHYGEDLINMVYEKYPKTKKIDEFKNTSEWFFVIVTRVLKVIPGDIVSMLLGAMHIKYIIYLGCSLLVRTPPMVSNTFIGSSIKTKSYTGAIISTLATIIISLVSTFIFVKNKDKKKV